MPQWHSQRLANCAAIWDTARQCPGPRVPEVPAHIEHAGYKCYLCVEPDALAPSSPLPVARELGSTSLMLLCHPTLTDEEIEKTCAVNLMVACREILKVFD